MCFIYVVSTCLSIMQYNTNYISDNIFVALQKNER